MKVTYQQMTNKKPWDKLKSISI